MPITSPGRPQRQSSGMIWTPPKRRGLGNEPSNDPWEFDKTAISLGGTTRYPLSSQLPPKGDYVAFVGISKSFIDPQTEKDFYELLEKWKAETDGLSSVRQISMNEHYQCIVGLGPKAIPIILQELAKHPDYLFWALKCIARPASDPIQENERGDIGAMAAAWIQWGKDNGYIAE